MANIDKPDSAYTISDMGLSLESLDSPAVKPVDTTSKQIAKSVAKHAAFRKIVPVLMINMVALVLAGLVGLGAYLYYGHNNKNANSGSDLKYSISSLPVNNPKTGANVQVNGADKLIINGQVSVGNTLTISPTATPDHPSNGQLYYNQQNNQLYFFNGTKFVSLSQSSSPQVTSINGISGNLKLGSGLSIDSSGQLSNSVAGVSSLQSQSGSISYKAGAGIAITNDGSGSYIISTNVNGLLGGSGTTGQIPFFSGASTLADSLLSQNNNVVTSSGDFSVTGQLNANGGIVTNNQDINGGTGTLYVDAINSHNNDNLNISSGNGVLSFVVGSGLSKITFNLPTTGASTQTICTANSSCATGGQGAVLLGPLAGNVSHYQADNSANAVWIYNNNGGNLLNLNGGNSSPTSQFLIDNNANVTQSGALTVQGNSVTIGSNTTAGQLNIADGTNSNLSIIQAGAPTGVGNVTYTLPSLAAGTSATLCYKTGSSANCAGAGGSVTGSGLQNHLALFTAAGTGSDIGNSNLQDASNVLTYSGSAIINALSGFTGNLLSLQLNNAQQFGVDYQGNVSQNGNTVFSGTSARSITGPSTGGLSVTVANGPLSLSTTGSGVLSVSSAGALNLSGNGASSYDVGTNVLSIQTAHNGAITTGSGLLTVGGNVSLPANPQAVSGTSLVQIGSALSGASSNSNGTYLGINNTTGVGSDFINLQYNNLSKFNVDNQGDLSLLGSIVGYSTLTLKSTTSSNVTLDSGTTGSILIGGDTVNAKTISIGPTGANSNQTTYNLGVNIAGAQVINIGSTSGATIANSATTVSIQGGTSPNAISIGTTGSVNKVLIGSTNTTSSTTLQGGSGGINLAASSINIGQGGGSPVAGLLNLLAGNTTSGSLVYNEPGTAFNLSLSAPTSGYTSSLNLVLPNSGYGSVGQCLKLNTGSTSTTGLLFFDGCTQGVGGTGNLSIANSDPVGGVGVLQTQAAFYIQSSAYSTGSSLVEGPTLNVTVMPASLLALANSTGAITSEFSPNGQYLGLDNPNTTSYSVASISQTKGSNTITTTGATLTANMQGGIIVFADGTNELIQTINISTGAMTGNLSNITEGTPNTTAKIYYSANTLNTGNVYQSGNTVFGSGSTFNTGTVWQTGNNQVHSSNATFNANMVNGSIVINAPSGPVSENIQSVDTVNNLLTVTPSSSNTYGSNLSPITYTITYATANFTPNMLNGTIMYPNGVAETITSVNIANDTLTTNASYSYAGISTPGSFLISYPIPSALTIGNKTSTTPNDGINIGGDLELYRTLSVTGSGTASTLNLQNVANQDNGLGASPSTTSVTFQAGGLLQGAVSGVSLNLGGGGSSGGQAGGNLNLQVYTPPALTTNYNFSFTARNNNNAVAIDSNYLWYASGGSRMVAAYAPSNVCVPSTCIAGAQTGINVAAWNPGGVSANMLAAVSCDGIVFFSSTQTSYIGAYSPSLNQEATNGILANSGGVSGLACKVVGGNIYLFWADSTDGYIGYAKINGSIPFVAQAPDYKFNVIATNNNFVATGNPALNDIGMSTNSNFLYFIGSKLGVLADAYIKRIDTSCIYTGSCSTAYDDPNYVINTTNTAASGATLTVSDTYVYWTSSGNNVAKNNSSPDNICYADEVENTILILNQDNYCSIGSSYNSGAFSIGEITTPSSYTSVNQMQISPDNNFLYIDSNIPGNPVAQISLPSNTPNLSATVLGLSGVNGAAYFQNTINSTLAFQIEDSGNPNAGAVLFGADTVNNIIGIGGSPTAGGATLQVTGNISTSSGCSVINKSTCTHGEALGVNGALYATSSNLNSAPDVAETIPVASDVQAYDVVSAGPDGKVDAVKSQTAYDPTTLGVISDGSSSVKINSNGGSESAALTGAYLVLVGRVPVHVNNQNGPIVAGDYLTSSDTPGYAMKATHAGPTIGKALANFNDVSGTVMIQTNLSYYNPPASVDTTAFSNITVSDTASLSSLQTTGNANFLGNISAEGEVLLKNSTDSTHAFQIQSQSVNTGTSLVDADTANYRVGIGTNTPGNLLSVGKLTTADSTAQIAVSTAGINGSLHNSGILVQTVAGQDGGYILQAQNSSGATLASIDFSGNLNVQSATISGHITTGNSGGLTTQAALDISNSGNGGSPSCTVIGNDTSGQVMLTDGLSGDNAGSQCTITFASPYTALPHPVITNAADVSWSQVEPYVKANLDNSTGKYTSFTINFIKGDTSQHTFVINYFNVQ